MKLLTFTYADDAFASARSGPRVGAMLGEAVVDLASVRHWARQARGLPPEPLPDTIYELISAGQPTLQYARNLVHTLEGADPRQTQGADQHPLGIPLEQAVLLPPVMRPMSLRDFYAFEGHVAATHADRGKEIPQQWYKFPVFYFSNPNAIFGPDELIPYPAYTTALDYELEVACIIGKVGINIPAARAREYIFGFTIFNDWSARDVQREETAVGLGPAKGKDFASSLGPYIVTPDELEDRATRQTGVYDLAMAARVNGEETSRGNWKDLHYSFGQMIARASQDVYLYPGDVLGSGTVGSGCLLETTHNRGPWLQPGDVVELEIERLGVLRNQIGPRPEA